MTYQMANAKLKEKNHVKKRGSTQTATWMTKPISNNLFFFFYLNLFSTQIQLTRPKPTCPVWFAMSTHTQIHNLCVILWLMHQIYIFH